MADILTDPMIADLVSEKKQLPPDYHLKIQAIYPDGQAPDFNCLYPARRRPRL